MLVRRQVVGWQLADRGLLAMNRSRIGDLTEPADAHEPLDLDGAVVVKEQGCTAGLLDAGEQHLAGVRVGGVLVEVVLVAVVEADDEADVGCRGEGGGAGADDEPACPVQGAHPG